MDQRIRADRSDSEEHPSSLPRTQPECTRKSSEGIMSTNVAIEIKDLTKKYEDRIAVDGINLEIYKGECFGLLGPNGAGKTTAMKMMYCSALVSSGELYVLGLNVKKNYREIKSRIGVV